MTSYKSYRLQTFFDTTKAAYPDMKIMAPSIRLSPVSGGAWLGCHVYSARRWIFMTGMGRNADHVETVVYTLCYRNWKLDGFQ
ncbi:hypothetical protein B9Z19DRAFT_1126887 [Tuber borchii]|uniref:Uncharacterized protein n=1 Tax=Tuber borchii TaxID=42251 RepID=A0A2T6ZSE6_TUBBO|nr:hypothetical protein B9Z19DRAFT_1126887 [Tuber borchii]